MRWRINPTIWFYKAEDVKVDCDKTPMQRTPTLSALRTGLSEFCPTSVVAGTTEGKLGVWQGGSLVSQGFPGPGNTIRRRSGPAWDVSAHESGVGRISAFD